MSFELDSLFNLDDFEESLNLSIIPNLVDRDNNLDTKQTDEEKNDTAHEDDPLEEVHFDVLITTTLQDENRNLISEMKEWKSKAEEHAKANNRFHQRLTGTYQAQTGIPAELITRLNKLERENQHLRAEITELKERVGEVGRENMVLCEGNTGKSRKLKGANKKVKNAKDVAVREEAKAKGAVHEKTQRQLAERKMKLERNEALAELQKYKKMSGGGLHHCCCSRGVQDLPRGFQKVGNDT
jgi:chromosome segregation ATPase